MNVLTGPWASLAAWAALITAIAGVATVIIRGVQIFARSFADLMNTLEEDNKKLRDALSSAEANRIDLSNQLVQVHTEIATMVSENSQVVLRLQHELDEYRQSNANLVNEVQSLKKQIADYAAVNQTLSTQIARLTKKGGIS